MTTPFTTRPFHHLVALGLAAVVTLGVLGGLDAQADRLAVPTDRAPAAWAGVAPVAPAAGLPQPRSAG